MGRLFNPDNIVFSSLSKLVDVVLLSFLWALFSVPIITMGASTSALYYTMTKTIRHNRDYVWRSFWGGFKSSFKQAVPMWIAYVVFMALMYMDQYLMGALLPPSTMRTIAVGFFIAMMVLGTLWIQYVFPYISRFSLDWRGVLRNCAFFAVKHFLWTIILVVLEVAAVLAVYIMPFALFFVPTIWAFLASLILERIFKKYMSKEDLEVEAMKNDKHPRG